MWNLQRLTWQVSLVALSFWSFHFASICAFGLLAYVGYIVYAFPSLFRLHHLNGLLLVFILLWAVSTYIFNVAFAFLNWKLGKVALHSQWLYLTIVEYWRFSLWTHAGHGDLGAGWAVALSHSWIFLTCTVLFRNSGGSGQSCEQLCISLPLWWGWTIFKWQLYCRR